MWVATACRAAVPSVSDCSGPCRRLYYAGLVLLIRRRVGRFFKSWWLDGLIAVLAVSALATA